MLSALLFSILALDGGGTTTFAMEGVFDPLLRSDVAIADNGEVFILDFQLARISRFDRNGKLLNTISKKGPGPAELGFPDGIYLWQNLIHVNDQTTNSIKRFEKDGSLVDQIRLPTRGLDAVRVRGGWITANLFSMQGDEPIFVKWVNEEMAEPQEIISWPRPAGGGAMMIRATPGSRPKIPFNPVSERVMMIADRAGNTVYVFIPGSPKIQVIDVAKKKVVRAISRGMTPIPFNEEYGNRELAEFKESRKRMPVDFVADFPEKFPAVREIYISAEDHLGIRRWTAYPSKSRHNLLMDANGAKMTPAYQTDNARQILLIQGDYAYINCFNTEDDEAFLLKVPVSAIDKTVAANPIDFSLELPRMRMIRR